MIPPWSPALVTLAWQAERTQIIEAWPSVVTDRRVVGSVLPDHLHLDRVDIGYGGRV